MTCEGIVVITLRVMATWALRPLLAITRSVMTTVLVMREMFFGL